MHSILIAEEFFSQTIKNESYKSMNGGEGLFELSKIEKDRYKISIVRRSKHDKLYELILLVEYSRIFVGFKNLFKKTKIKSNKDENMMSLYNSLKNLVEKLDYDPFEFGFLLEQIKQGGGNVTQAILFQTKLNTDSIFPDTKRKRFKSLKNVVTFLKEKNKFF